MMILIDTLASIPLAVKKLYDSIRYYYFHKYLHNCEHCGELNQYQLMYCIWCGKQLNEDKLNSKVNILVEFIQHEYAAELARLKQQSASYHQINQVYVINLERQPERMVQLNATLQNYNIPFTRVNAVDGSRMNFKSLSHQGFLQHIPAEFNSSLSHIVGIFFSHMLVWQDAVSKGHRYIMVFEDDIVIPNSEFSEFFLENWKEYQEGGYDVMLLGQGCGINPTKKGEYLHHYQRSLLAHAYVIKLSAIKRLMVKMTSIHVPIDQQWLSYGLQFVVAHDLNARNLVNQYSFVCT